MHINKIIAGLLAAGLLAPLAAFAQTATTSTSSIQALLDQIKALQQQIAALQAQQQQNIATLVSTLKEGSRGDQVIALQAFLAMDPSLYPEGKITGFFGRLTAQAVKRFQKRHGLAEVGTVGPRTLKKLNELLGHAGSMRDKDNDDDEDKNDDRNEIRNATSTREAARKITICHKSGQANETISVGAPAVAGHLKHGDKMGACAGGTATTTPDTIAPVISGVAVSGIGSTTATVAWTTSENAVSKVYYATTTPVDLLTAFTAGTASSTTFHSFNLSGLSASTTYYYIAESKDAAGNTATTSSASFATTN